MKIYKTKTFWTGVATLLTGAAMVLSGDSSNGIQTIAIGLATIFTRQAIEKNKK